MKDTFLMLASGYLGKYLVGIENDPKNQNVPRIKRILESALQEIDSAAELPVEFKNTLPKDTKVAVYEGSIIIDMGRFKIRYFNHNVPDVEIPSRENLEEEYDVIEKRIGRYLTRQILVRKGIGGKVPSVEDKEQSVADDSPRFRGLTPEPEEFGTEDTSQGRVAVVKYHGEAYNKWEELRLVKGTEDAVLIHIDAHDDMVCPQILPQPRNINDIANINYSETAYIAPAVYYGLVDEIWIVKPEEYNLSPTGSSDFYAAIYTSGYGAEQFYFEQIYPQPGVHFIPEDAVITGLKKVKVHYFYGIDKIPDLEKETRPVLLDIDTDFFASKKERYHKISRLTDEGYEYDDLKRIISSDIKKAIDILEKKNIRPVFTTIAESPDYTFKQFMGHITSVLLEEVKRLPEGQSEGDRVQQPVVDSPQTVELTPKLDQKAKGRGQGKVTDAITKTLEVVKRNFRERSFQELIAVILEHWPDRNLTKAEKNKILSLLENESQKKYFKEVLSLITRRGVKGNRLCINQLLKCIYQDKMPKDSDFPQTLYAVKRDKFIMICDSDMMWEIDQLLMEKQRRRELSGEAFRKFVERTQEVSVDQNGRIVLDSMFFKELDFPESIVLIGRPDKKMIEIWPQKNIGERKKLFLTKTSVKNSPASATLPLTFKLGKWWYNKARKLGLSDEEVLDRTALRIAPWIEELVKVGLAFALLGTVSYLGVNPFLAKVVFIFFLVSFNLVFVVLHLFNEKLHSGMFDLSFFRGLKPSERVRYESEVEKTLRAAGTTAIAGIFISVCFSCMLLPTPVQFFCAWLISALIHCLVNINVKERRRLNKDIGYATLGKGGWGKWDTNVLDAFRKQINTLSEDVVVRLMKIKSMGIRRKLLKAEGVESAEFLGGKFIEQELERYIREHLGKKEKVMQDNRLRRGRNGRYLVCYISDDFDYIIKTYFDKRNVKKIQVEWLDQGNDIARKRLKGLAVPTYVIDVTNRKNKKLFTYFVREAKKERRVSTDIAIIQEKVDPLIDYLKVLVRSDRVQEAKELLDEYKKVVIEMYRRGVVDTDFGGTLANYGIDRKTGKMYIFDFGDLNTGIYHADEFVSRLDEITNQYVEDGLRMEVNDEIADYFKENAFKESDFQDENGHDIFGIDYDPNHPEKYHTTFYLSEEKIRDIFSHMHPYRDMDETGFATLKITKNVFSVLENFFVSIGLGIEMRDERILKSGRWKEIKIPVYVAPWLEGFFNFGIPYFFFYLLNNLASLPGGLNVVLLAVIIGVVSSLFVESHIFNVDPPDSVKNKNIIKKWRGIRDSLSMEKINKLLNAPFRVALSVSVFSGFFSLLANAEGAHVGLFLMGWGVCAFCHHLVNCQVAYLRKRTGDKDWGYASINQGVHETVEEPMGGGFSMILSGGEQREEKEGSDKKTGSEFYFGKKGETLDTSVGWVTLKSRPGEGLNISTLESYNSQDGYDAVDDPVIDGEFIAENAEFVINRLFHAFQETSVFVEKGKELALVSGDVGVEASQKEKKEKVIIFIDSDLADLVESEMKEKMTKLIERFQRISNNNKELNGFLKNIEIIVKPGEDIAKTAGNITTRGKINPNNIIVLTKGSNVNIFNSVEGLAGNAVITAVDDAENGEYNYLPVSELLLYSLSRYLRWGEDMMTVCYSKIPNAVPLEKLTPEEREDIIGVYKKTIVIKLIPDAVKFVDNDAVEIHECIEAILRNA
ncbi:MAG: UPF0489 family protein [Candidatus Omnitrophica bacterium]|nr:UPF0489 family protein [Candidatus Omnitrophota bacterium]